MENPSPHAFLLFSENNITDSGKKIMK